MENQSIGRTPSSSLRLEGHIVDVVNRRIFDGEIEVNDGIISSVRPRSGIASDAQYIMPGFVDAHVHIESSMIMPSEFARIALRHGTVGAVCDPHEIANVLGVEGVELMLGNASGVPFHFGFAVPSCVPSCGSDIETSGHVLDRNDVASLLRREDICCLAEMMNYPGVLNGDGEVMAKIKAAKEAGKPIDGHAPGLMGDRRKAYAGAGISTDHECSTLDEGRDAIRAGMKVIIREGTSAKNFAALSPLIAEAPDRVMFCMDDCSPYDLLSGHINRLVARAIGDGYDPMDVLQAACVNPVLHYRLPIGLLREGDPADFICVSCLTSKMRVTDTYIRGEQRTDIPTKPLHTIRRYDVCNANPITADDLRIPECYPLHVIVVNDGSLLTGHELAYKKDDDMQKIVCYNRYTPGARPSVAYARGFGITHGAMAQTIAHDCHNIVAIGSSDEFLAEVINRLIEIRGGKVVTDGIHTKELPLPIAGLISPESCEEVAMKNVELADVVFNTGCRILTPFITLGFVCLPVIPDLKITDKGLFDGREFRFVER